MQQRRFPHHRHLEVLLQNPAQLVVGEQIGRVGHADEHTRAPVLEHDGAKAPRLRFGQAPHHILIQVVELEIDVLDVQLPRDRLADLLVVDEALLDKHAPEPAAALFLLLERDPQLLLRNRLLCDEDVAEADLFRASHGGAPYEGGAAHIIRFYVLRQTTTIARS